MPLWLSQLHIEYLTNRCRILPRKFLRLPNRFLDVLRRYAFRFEREPERKTAGFGLGSVLYERTNAGAHRNHAQHRTLVLSALLAVGLHRITAHIRARGKRVKPLKAGTRGTISRREPSSLRGDRLGLAPHLGQLRVDGRESILRPPLAIFVFRSTTRASAWPLAAPAFTWRAVRVSRPEASFAWVVRNASSFAALFPSSATAEPTVFNLSAVCSKAELNPFDKAAPIVTKTLAFATCPISIYPL